MFGIDHTVDLITGVIGGADPGAMRRLRRGIRRYDEAHPAEVAPDGDTPDSLVSLRAAILDDAVADRYAKALSDTELAPLNRVRKVVGAGSKAHDAGRIWNSYCGRPGRQPDTTGAGRQRHYVVVRSASRPTAIWTP